MHESIYTEKLSVFSPTGVTTMKVDVIKHETYVEIRLIELNNIFTLFVCTISQSDFYMYKKEQGILVSFERFVPILVNMFYKASTGSDGLSASITTATTENSFNLQFIEQTEFRNLIKLTLPFNKPEEYQYRKYLGDLLKRMEGDNVKLIKENKILRDKAIKGDKNLQDKVKYLETDNSEMKKRLELVNEELNTLEVKYNQERDEFYSGQRKLMDLERDNTQLYTELEHHKRRNYQEKYEELLKKEENRSKEESRQKDKIHILEQENKELKDQIDKVAREIEKDFGDKATFTDLKSKMKNLDEKLKSYKSEIKERKNKMEALQSENKSLQKKLENAQNVYNHFYNQKVDDKGKGMDNFDLEPENPPNM